ncbi:lysophospholipid acyltransferase family protein [uncultured Desulfovibrio sp.]|uniref:lysophospholipid acyltransferase family protein n=1 Tax=uncultured Desulfovibrio sp. TaxID=167968 RepID=UPI002609AE6F|nr:lysophospholipid acyltransferase family protein [uncultured Desulfovibrio sp.]
MQTKRPITAVLGSRLQYGFFEVLVRCRMLFAARVVLAFVVLYYAMLPHVRQRCAAYIGHRFPRAGALGRFVHAYRLYLNFGQVLLDRMIAGVTGRFPFCETDQQVRQRFAEAGANPHGCIVLTAHIGAWQVGIAGLEQFDRPVNVVQLHNPEDQGKHYFQHGRGRPFKIIDSADPVGSMVEAAAALRRGEVVCLMGDRMHGTRQAGQGVDVAFMGGSIRIPASAYALASITGAELLMLFTVREKGITRVFMAERLAVPAGLPRRDVSVFQPYAQQFAAALETVVERHPYQFFNFYDMWSQ